MTLDRLEQITCEHFNMTSEEFRQYGRGEEKISKARHFYRAIATDKYQYTHRTLMEKYGWDTSTVAHSRKIIFKDEVFGEEYLAYVRNVGLNDVRATEIFTDKSGLERITNEAFDERFYRHPTRNNEKTGLPYFPAFHYVTSLGSPEPIGLTKWRQDKGHFSDYILERSSVIGSYVHNAIDDMIKHDFKISHETIHRDFPNHKEAQRVKECLLGFLNFMAEEEPVVLASEQMMCGKDFGFTMDNKFKIKSDGYKNVWVSDWKTSKVANDDHKMQVEVMRRVAQADRGMVIVLGNTTKKKYTMTQIPIKDHDYHWFRFNAIKETAYVEIMKRNLVKPREDNMPSVFSLSNVNFKRMMR